MSTAITLLLPIACAWARHHEASILKTGVSLSATQIDTAKRLGILFPQRIRLRAVAQVPPLNRLMKGLGKRLGVVSDQTIGMTLRYGIFIREDRWTDRRLLIHELVHVAQYERLGGFRRFLKQYLQECFNPGYPLGELEQEAFRAELNCMR